ncbi:hypothetical protein CFU_2711 [Collimonas fungivorans Ter331]|uniref:Uncharacterized protein n=1 Tax=Collimonas fungivorans (strain Ter331) TaxID=1005048 RepID=G0AHD2_COLFT|nr:hypothetical protein CFU_2711 [Collimonas fungivorans Ter331]
MLQVVLGLMILIFKIRRSLLLPPSALSVYR